MGSTEVAMNEVDTWIGRKKAPLWQDNNRGRRRKKSRDGNHWREGTLAESLVRRCREGPSRLFCALDWRSEWELEGEAERIWRAGLTVN